MEMYTFSVKGLVLSSFDHVCRAFAGLWAGILAPLRDADRQRVKSDAERRADNARQNYNAQAMAATWQSYRNLR